MLERQRFLTSIGASALLHLLLLGGLFLVVTAPKKPVALPSLDVDLSSIPLPVPRRAAPPVPAVPAPKQEARPEPPPPQVAAPAKQIVAPPDAGEEKEPPNAQLFSDRNNTVPEEMVRKGDQGTDPKATDGRLARKGGGADAKQPPQQAAAQPPPASQRAKEAARQVAPAPAPRPPARGAARTEPGDGAERLASIPSLDKLLPNAADLARQAPLPEATAQPERSGRDLLNSGGEVFGGRPGTRDYLPHVREGNITLLNTKADLFAPFVRRVAGRVFENLDLAFSNLRYRRGGTSGRALATVEAVMDRSGKFVSATLVEHSGANGIGVDRMLLGAATADTFFDANPPGGAEAIDGKIHFVLLVDLQVDSAPDPRTGREGTSYYGIAGVGLK